MKLAQLRYFLEVCRLNNISEAAKKLYISQPSLTVAIKKLEKELGVILFHRSKQGVTLSTEGEFFLAKVEPLIKELDSLLVEMVSIGENSNVIKIGVPPMMGSFLFPQIFAKFSSKYPEINVEIVEHGTYKILQLLLDDTIDITFLIKESYINKSLQYQPLVTRDFKLYVPLSHRLARAQKITIDNLKDEPLILLNEEFYTYQVVQDFFKNHSIKPKVVLKTTQINTVKRFINENVAVSILLDGALPEKDGFIAIPIEGIPSVSIGLAWQKDKFLTDSTKKMISFIQKIR